DRDEKRVFSNSSAYLVTEILSGNSPDDIHKYFYNENRKRFAWKTGTSYGKRDAWAIGYNKTYTIGVWLGNFNGKGSPHLSGTEMAVPLLYELFGAIDRNTGNEWFEKPDEVVERYVCTESGLLPTEFCQQTTTDYFIQDLSHNKYCNVHKELFTNSDNTIQYCPECLPVKNYVKRVFTIYEPRINIWNIQNNIQVRMPPKHNAECTAMYTDSGPQIVSPSDNYEYLIEKNSGQEILLSAVSEGTVKTHYWFLNENYFAKSEPGERLFFKPKQGELKITCMDDMGRDQSIAVNIKYY
ncbi:MAG: penicillin-binding protein 1C, partial [Ignavibacteria bacterium]